MTADDRDDHWGDRDALRRGIPVFLCSITKNPSGTDTWAIGRPCQCHGCRAHLGVQALLADGADAIAKLAAAEAEVARLRADLSKARSAALAIATSGFDEHDPDPEIAPDFAIGGLCDVCSHVLEHHDRGCSKRGQAAPSDGSES